MANDVTRCGAATRDGRICSRAAGQGHDPQCTYGHGNDDREVVTAEWLESTGWVRADFKDLKRWEFTLRTEVDDFDGATIRDWLCIHDSEPCDWWSMELLQQASTQKRPDAVAVLTHLEKTTRGHVRRLIEALNPAE